MKRQIPIIILFLLAIGLIGVGIIFNFTSSEPQVPKEPTPVDEEIYKEPMIKELPLKSIKTADKKIIIKDTIAYNRDGISELIVTITTKEDYSELYLGITFNFENESEQKVIYLQDVKINTEQEYLLQSLKDWTTIKSWSVKQLTKDEAFAAGYNVVD